MIIEKAYAKINLSLDVISKMDSGYHSLEMVMAPIKLHDTLTIKKTDDLKITIESNSNTIPLDENNIVYRISNFFIESYNLKTGIYIYIDKQIPIGGGLGGGSADGAATLRGLNKLFNLNLTLDALAHIGLHFGADVPFCIYNRLALVKGVGEKIEFLNSNLNLSILLINPNIFISTKKIFSKVNIKKIVHPSTSLLIKAIENNSFEDIGKNLSNSLEHFTFSLSNEIKNIKKILIENNYKYPLMSGSGSTFFIIFKSKNKLSKNYVSIKKILPNEYLFFKTEILTF